MTSSPRQATEDRDDSVRDAYRKLAIEQPPERLNETILRQAANAGKLAESRSGQWLRPVALAASMLLCVAIVIDMRDQPLSASNGADAFRVTEAPIMDDAAAIARLQRDPGQQIAPESACSAHEQASPDSWYACILRLEKNGLVKAARVQEEELSRVFPEFETLPAARQSGDLH